MTRSSNPPAITIAASNIQYWAPGWERFRRDHPEWPYRPTEGEPIYFIPIPAIARLSRAGRKGGPAFLPDVAAAERSFTQVCQQYRAIGVWDEMPVHYDLLTPSPPPVSREVWVATGWAISYRSYLHDLRTVEALSQRGKGVPGWLLTDPTYANEVAELQSRWATLPPAQRPQFPLHRALPVATLPDDAQPATPDAARFAQDIRNFLDKWGLMRLATWDLPDPQGSLLPNLLPPGAPASPTHGIYVFLPLHYPVQQNDQLLRDILRFQRTLAQSLQIHESLAGLPHAEHYGTIFEVLHLERSICSRFSTGRMPHGQTLRMEEAIAEALGVSVSTVQQCRKAISKCRRGQRDKVSWLRP